jgi:hypothetical protein
MQSKTGLTSTTRVLASFAAGALVAILAIYYYTMARDAALRDARARMSRETSTAAGAPAQLRAIDASSRTNQRFAARLSYELARIPDEARSRSPARFASAPPPSAGIAALPPIAAAVLQPLPDVGPRIANARPISAAPPDPRSTTREIQLESLAATVAPAQASAVGAPRATASAKPRESRAPESAPQPRAPIPIRAVVGSRAPETYAIPPVSFDTERSTMATVSR